MHFSGDTAVGPLEVPDMVRAGAVMRQLIQYEVEENFDDEQSIFSIQLTRFELPPGGGCWTAELVSQKPDRDFVKIARRCFKFAEVLEKRGTKPFGPTLDVSKRICGWCGKTEEMAGDFEKCGNCRKVSYCSTECKDLAWPEHKASCRKKKGKKGRVRR